MYRDILRKLNFGIFIVIALMIAIVQSTIFGYFPLSYIQPDALLIVAVYFGFRRNILEGGIFMMLAAIIMETHSSTAPHFFLTLYLYAFLIAKLLSRMLVAPDFFSSVGIVVGLTLLKRLGLLILLSTGGRAENGLKHFFIYLIPGLLVQALLTPIFFAWFMKLDIKTYKDDHAEDEYDINKGL